MELNLDLESFLALEKKRLQVEKQSLSARTTALVKPNNIINSYQNEQKDDDADECPAVKAIKNKEYINEIKCNRRNKTALDKCLIQQVFADEAHTRVNDLPPRPPPTATMSSALVSSAIRTTNTGSSMVTKTKTTGCAARVQELSSPNELENSFTDMPVVEMLDCFETFHNDLQLENTSSARGLSSRSDETNVEENVSKHHTDDGWSKTQKDLANSKEVKSATNVPGAEQQQLTHRSGRLRKSENKDDMEQWVSDTFYSYFPGFNNEFQKRQNLVRERQQEYQQNLLKHQNQQQMLKTAKSKEHANAAARSPHQSLSTAPSTARSCSTTATNNTSSTNKTDLEIIVNNPNYAPKYSVSVVATSAAAAAAPPGSSRRKLLQDLQHTDLESIIAGDVISERNRQSADIELARKKDYQRDLMLQIEEKRRSIEALRVEDRRQDEAITRRLQEQLKTIHLEEELEKENLRAEKLRFNTEQKRLMREHLLAKLENDDRLLNEQKATKRSEMQASDPSKKSSSQNNNNDNADDDRNNNNNNNNRVYKYFSNSARHEYRRGEPLLDNLELDLELPESPQQLGVERECFHLSEKVCPKCGEPLKNYEASCLRCQRKVSFKLKRNEGAAAELHVSAAASDDHGDCDDCNEHYDDHANTTPDTVVNRRSYSLVCSKCERLYSLCPSCVIKSDVCRSCHRQRNVCMSCRRSLCSFCLEEIACGRDTERCHINDQPEDELGDNVNKVYSSRKMNDSGGGIQESAFQVLELNYAAPKTNHDGVETINDNINNRNNRNNNNNNNNSNNNNKNNNNKNNNQNNNYYYQHQQHDKICNKVPPYSLNIERNSIFYPSHEPSSSVFEHLPKIVDRNLTFDFDSSLHTDQNSNLERVRKETERRLSRYLKNYGDLTKYNIEKGIGNGKSIPNISTKNHRRLQHQLQSNSESHDRGTQTTPSSVARRDVVLYEAHNLSMPLLREMPRMTRQEAQKQLRKQASSTSNNKASSSMMMDNLKSRWEIPAVQKYSISTSPPVLTQVGAMRKQLQADRLLSEDY